MFVCLLCLLVCLLVIFLFLCSFHAGLRSKVKRGNPRNTCCSCVIDQYYHSSFVVTFLHTRFSSRVLRYSCNPFSFLIIIPSQFLHEFIIHLFVCSFVCLFVRLFVCLFVCSFVCCLFVCLCIGLAPAVWRGWPGPQSAVQPDLPDGEFTPPGRALYDQARSREHAATRRKREFARRRRRRRRRGRQPVERWRRLIRVCEAETGAKHVTSSSESVGEDLGLFVESPMRLIQGQRNSSRFVSLKIASCFAKTNQDLSRSSKYRNGSIWMENPSYNQEQIARKGSVIRL